LDNNAIRVTILNDPLRQDCDASCGTNWSSLQALDQARKQINERFDRDIQLTYLDLTRDTTDSDVLKWNEEIKSKKPVVTSITPERSAQDFRAVRYPTATGYY